MHVVSGHHDDGGKTNLDNIPRECPDTSAQPACTDVAVSFQRVDEQDIVKKERFEGIKRCRGGGVYDGLYRRCSFGVSKVAGVGSTFDDGF